MQEKLPMGEFLAPTENERSLPQGEIFDVLSNARRRCIVHYLKQHEGRRVELREIVDYVAAWEEDTTIDRLDSAKRKSVYAAIRQTHLPMMEDAGLIEYEHLRGDVELTDSVREVQLYLERVPQNDIPWSEYYLGLSMVALALTTVVWFGLPPFDGVSAHVLAFLLAVLFTVSAAVHTYQSRRHRLGTGEYELEEPQ